MFRITNFKNNRFSYTNFDHDRKYKKKTIQKQTDTLSTLGGEDEPREDKEGSG